MDSKDIKTVAKNAAIKTYKEIYLNFLKEAQANSIQDLASLVNASITYLGNGAYSFYIAQDSDCDNFPQILNKYRAQLKTNSVTSISYSSPNRTEKQIYI